ncbi:MAG: hypothetical protein ABIS20_20990 [Thermoanaerobaculia bacterium]
MVLIGLEERLGGQQAAILGEGDEEHPVEELLGIEEEDFGDHGRVGVAEPAEDVTPDSGVLRVVPPGQLQTGLLRGLQKLIQVPRSRRGDDPFGGEEEDELPERRLLLGQSLDLEPFEGPLVTVLVVEPDLAEVGDQDPVAREVDGVAVGLVDRRHPPAREGAVEGIARSFTLQGEQGPVPVAAELSDHGVRELAVHFHALLPREGIALAGRGRATVAQDSIKEVGQIVWEELGLGQLFRPRGLQQAGPFPQDLSRRLDLGPDRQRRRPGGENFGAKEGFAFDRHGQREFTVSERVRTQTSY